MKSASEAHIGDTFYHVGEKVETLPGFQPAQSMVFAGIFPVDTNDFRKLDENIKKLTLNDASVTVHKETSHALGQGWRLGFLGTLHMDVFRQRLENVNLKKYIFIPLLIFLIGIRRKYYRHSTYSTLQRYHQYKKKFVKKAYYYYCY
jgi:translation elongation factor EF-4